MQAHSQSKVKPTHRHTHAEKGSSLSEAELSISHRLMIFARLFSCLARCRHQLLQKTCFDSMVEMMCLFCPQ